MTQVHCGVGTGLVGGLSHPTVIPLPAGTAGASSDPGTHQTTPCSPASPSPQHLLWLPQTSQKPAASQATPPLQASAQAGLCPACSPHPHPHPRYGPTYSFSLGSIRDPADGLPPPNEHAVFMLVLQHKPLPAAQWCAPHRSTSVPAVTCPWAPWGQGLGQSLGTGLEPEQALHGIHMDRRTDRRMAG